MTDYHIYSPNCSLKACTTFFNLELEGCLQTWQNQVVERYHRILEVNPLALFKVPWITGRALHGCADPRNENDVRSILKFAFPVTARQNGK